MNEALGAKFLDEKVPGWEKEIDLDALDLTSCRNCVLGQIGGDYYEMCTDLDIPEERGDPLAQAFSEEASTSKWKRLIRYRLRKQAA